MTAPPNHTLQRTRGTTFLASLGVAPRSVPSIDKVTVNFECGMDSDRSADLAKSNFDVVFPLWNPYDLRITVRLNGRADG